MKRSTFNGNIIIKSSLNPEHYTSAAIHKGKLIEPLEEIFKRVCADNCRELDAQSISQTISLTDENHFSVIGKLFANRIYYLEIETTEMNEPFAKPVGSNSEELGKVYNHRLTPVVWAFDKRVLLHECFQRSWPESAYRLRKSVEALFNCERAQELFPCELRVELSNLFNLTNIEFKEKHVPHNESVYVQPRLASLEEICLVHDRLTYEQFIVNGTALPCLPSDVYCIGDACSSTAVRVSAASVIDVAEVVYNSMRAAREKIEQSLEISEHTEEVKCSSGQKGLIGLCLVRPPGHHCKFDSPSGFCLINNVAIGCEYLLSKFYQERKKTPLLIEEANSSRCNKQELRIAIIDLDVHFGDGTALYVDREQSHQWANIKNNNEYPLLYISLHRYDDCQYYPYDKMGANNYTGEQVSECICNVAINTHAYEPKLCHEVMSDYLIQEVMTRIFIPRLTEFKPDILFVSLGFDALYGDPLGKMGVVNGLTKALVMLKMWCLNGNVEKELTQTEEKFNIHEPVGMIVVLEGGYNPECVSNGIVSAAYALTFPHNDSDVEHKSEIKIPPTWNELRERCRRRWCKENSELRKDEIDKDVIYEEQIADDETLLVRHITWCKDLIDKWLDQHIEKKEKLGVTEIDRCED